MFQAIRSNLGDPQTIKNCRDTNSNFLWAQGLIVIRPRRWLGLKRFLGKGLDINVDLHC